MQAEGKVTGSKRPNISIETYNGAADPYDRANMPSLHLFHGDQPSAVNCNEMFQLHTEKVT